MDAQTVSILLLGDRGVGKSTFLSRLSQLRGKNSLDDGSPEPPLLRDGDQPFVVELRSQSSTFRLEFSDTASPENWRCLRPDIVILSYDISRRASLESLREWSKEVRSVFVHSDTLPILVLGLKRDLRREDDPNGILYPHEGCSMAQSLRADMYLECSAVTGMLMAEVLQDISRRAVQTVSGGGQSEGACAVM